MNYNQLWLIILFVTFTSIRAFADPPLTSQNLPKAATYEQLVKEIKTMLDNPPAEYNQFNIRPEVIQAWKLGSMISRYLQHDKQALKEGPTRLATLLSQDLNLSTSALMQRLAFAQLYPEKPPQDSLPWSHYSLLLYSITPAQRQTLIRRIKEENWDYEKLEREIKILKGVEPKNRPIRPLESKPGLLFTYRVIRAAEGPNKNELVLNLGFDNYYLLSNLRNIKAYENDFVHGEKNSFTVLPSSEVDPNNLHTYQAYIREVSDGDSFKALVDLGFGITALRKFRMRGIDSPEMGTPAGFKSKEYLAAFLMKSQPFQIKSEKIDKYNRYLADVFVGNVYVNRKMIDDGFAVIEEA